MLNNQREKETVCFNRQNNNLSVWILNNKAIENRLKREINHLKRENLIGRIFSKEQEMQMKIQIKKIKKKKKQYLHSEKN